MTTGPPEAGWLLDAGSHEVIAPLPGAHQMTDEPRRVVELLAQILSRLEAIDKKLEQACAAVGVQISP